MMSKLVEAGEDHQRSFAFDFATIFACCLILSFLHTNSASGFPQQLLFLVVGWSIGWFFGRIGVLSLLIVTIGVVVFLSPLLQRDISESGFGPLFFRSALPIVAMGQIAASLRKMTEHLHFITGQDPLTGLLNQQRFVEQVEKKVLANRGISTHVAIAFLDCDHFKTFNDTHGHLRGDQYLIDVANRIFDSLQSNDLAARFGGDEFAILLAIEEERSVQERVTEIQQSISSVIPENLHQPISWSIGVATSPVEIGANEIINAADQAMYTAKRKGPGQIHIVTAPAPNNESMSPSTT